MPYVTATDALNRRSVRIDNLVDEHGQQEWREPLVATPNVRVVLLMTPPGAKLAPHYHPRADEVFHVLRGVGGFAFGDDKEILAGPGTVLCAPRGVRHALRAVGDEPFIWMAIVTPNEDAGDEQLD